mgnify:CR=1 FL=1
MNQTERRQFLIQELLKEQDGYRHLEVPKQEEEQKRLLRGLMNIRPACRISKEVLQIQDAYLTEETVRKGITHSDELDPIQPGIYLWKGDITTLACDAIVNAANSGMTGCYVPNHRCIDNCIHTFAGMELRLECDRIMREQGYEEPTGQAKLTPAYNLPCRYILHTVGPIVTGQIDENGLCLVSELLSILSGTGGRKWPGKCGILLCFNRGVWVSEGRSSADRSTVGAGIYEECDKCKEGDIQCFSGRRSGNLQQNPQGRQNGCTVCLMRRML